MADYDTGYQDGYTAGKTTILEEALFVMNNWYDEEAIKMQIGLEVPKTESGPDDVMLWYLEERLKQK